MTETLTHDDALVPFAEGVWIGTAPARILGMPLTATMAVLRLGDGSLLIYSPVHMTPERRAAVEALGRVSHLYAPNLYHHLWLGEWASAFPPARVHAPQGLGKKRPNLRIDRLNNSEPDSSFAGVVDELSIEGFRLCESVLFYRPASTLIVADLVHNIGQPHHWWTRWYTQLMGFYGRVALSRMIRWAGFSDRRTARRSVESVLALPFDRVIVGHGLPITEDARDALARAYAWLQSSR